MDPPPPPSREEAPAEKRPLDAAEPESAETAAKKQRLADPSSPIDPKVIVRLAALFPCDFRFELDAWARWITVAA